LQVYHFEPGGIDTKQPHSVGPGKTTYVFNSLRFFILKKNACQALLNCPSQSHGS